MTQRSSKSLLGALVFGFAAGLGGAVAMDRFMSLSGRCREVDHSLPYSEQEWDATSRIANSTALWMTGRNLSRRELKKGAELVHYATAGIAGSLYGAMVYRSRAIVQSRILSGLVGLGFGVSVWYLGNELFLPALSVLKREDYTASMRTDALVAHIVYGVVTALACHQLMETSPKVNR